MKLYIRANTDTALYTKIANIMDIGDYSFYGIRSDDRNLSIGDVFPPSHALFQEPDYDEDGELIYPYMHSGPYAGFYDAGELDGTSVLDIDATYDEAKQLKYIENTIRQSSRYYGCDHMYLVGSDTAIPNDFDTDEGEMLFRDPVVLLKIK